MDNSVLEHATEKRSGSFWSLQPVYSGALYMEPINNFSFLETTLYLIFQILSEMDNLVWEQAREKK